VRESKAAGIDMWPGQHSAGRRGLKMNSTIFPDSNRFKNLQTLTDSKSTFPCSKNLK
jgi:hypothetical protein